MKNLLLVLVTLVALAVLAFVVLGGLTSRDQGLMVTIDEPVVENEAPPRTVKLFYYNQAKDTDATGNVLCSRDGLVPVMRPITGITPIETTLRLLLEGSLTDTERAAGISTEYPLPGVAISSVALGTDGTLRIALNDPQNKLTGGSCRTAILANQIVATAEQFAEVSRVEFVPDDVFQP